MKPSKRYGQDAELLTAFRNAYVDLLNHARLKEGTHFLPQLGPAVDNQGEDVVSRNRTALAVFLVLLLADRAQFGEQPRSGGLRPLGSRPCGLRTARKRDSEHQHCDPRRAQASPTP